MVFIEMDRNTMLYLVVLFTVSYSIEFIIVFEANSGNYAFANILMILLVFMPATIAGLMVNMFKEPPYFLRTRFKDIRFFLIAYLYPLFLIVVAAILLDLLGFDIDWGLTAYKTRIYQIALQREISPERLYEIAVMSVLIAPFVYAVFALGEEIGWRGYLLDKLLTQNSLERVIIFIGTIWALWHAPLIIFIGYNYKTLRALGLLLFIPFCIAHGTVLIWLRLRTRSILLPALGHGAINGFVWYGSALYPDSGELLHLVLGIPGIIAVSILGFALYMDLRGESNIGYLLAPTHGKP